MAVSATRLTLLVALTMGPAALAQERVLLGSFAIDATEVSIAQFDNFVEDTDRETSAEAEGGGFEFAGGWTRRAGWTYSTPFGGEEHSETLPAVHVTWSEARDYCLWAGGRLPTRSEWSLAAYTEQRLSPGADFDKAKVYPYPTGDTGYGANTRDHDQWPRLAPVGQTRAGINGLYDMGANAWEWLADRKGDDALTAGGSWWYGTEQMRESAMQWKPADFYVVYIGFRCAYDSDQ